MNNQYFGKFLNNHTWKTLQGSHPLGRKYWESPRYYGKTKGNVNIYTKDTFGFGFKGPVPPNTKFDTVNQDKWNWFDHFAAGGHPERFPNTKQFWRWNAKEGGIYTQAEQNQFELYKKGLNTGWFPDYAGDFQNLKESGTTTPHNFDFSQTFKPGQMSANDENLFYNIQLGQNMRMQALQKYGGAHGNGFYHRAKSYYFAVTL